MKNHLSPIQFCSLLGVLLLAGCSSSSDKMHTQTIPDADYRDALSRTAPANFSVPEPGSTEEKRMLEAFRGLFADYSVENLRENTTRVYAADVYFRDAFKQFSDPEEIRDYFITGREALQGAEFIFNRVIRSEDEFYVDWTMRLDFKSTPEGTWEESIGMTHVRFNEEGKVIFHQDYWDPTDIVYRRIPVAKQLINYVKKKM